MDASDSVAVVALIVSLIALVVTLIQLLQSSATTAEGWRQCGPASIGRWSMFRDWRWHWRELRYETFFTTPEILSMSEDEVDVLLNDHAILFLDSARQESASTDVEHQGNDFDVPVSNKPYAFGPDCHIDYTKKDDVPRRALHILGIGSLPPHIQEQWETRRRRIFSSNLANQHSQTWWRKVLPTGESVTLTVENSMASWAPFLNILYRYQRDTLKMRPSDKPLFEHQTFLAIRLRQDSWDFVPPELVRPPARTRLGDLILMTQRMGWSWTHCDPTLSDYRAENQQGPGCTIYSSRIRGLGTVFHFEALSRGDYFQPRQMLCNEKADKMFFCIIPGDEELGVPEVKAQTKIAQTRKVIDWDDLYNQLKFPSSVEDMRKVLPYWYCTIQNDMLPLLAPFMPSDECPFVRIRNPTPSDGGPHAAKESFFRPWQIRCVLLIMLERSDFSGKDELLTLFGKLRQESLFMLWRNQSDLVGDFVQSNVSTPLPNDSEKQQILDIIQKLRDIHHTTTVWFEKMNEKVNKKGKNEKDDEDEHENRPTFYMNLVRAHFDLVAQTAVEWKTTEESKRNPHPTLEEIQRLGRPHGGHRPQLASLCRAWLPDDLKSWRLKQSLREHYKPKQLSKDEILQSWWYLIIRGIAWRMSVEIETPESPSFVPWWLYRDMSHVWIV